MLKNFFSGISGSGKGNDFVGQYVELGQQKLRIRRVLGEGGYGFVFAAQDTATGKEYALKRLMAADDTVKQEIFQEINVLKKLKGHKNIVKFISAASSGNEQTSHGMTEFLILSELCSGGQLIDVLQESSPRPLPFDQMLKSFAQTCMAVSHMHKQSPPIIHRDLKIENLLFSVKGLIKLCDFGSSTTKELHPNENWTALQRSLAEDEIQKNTTPMYRAPEMIDLYSNYPVTAKADVWALGCILYYMCYMEHPFADGAKLRILNAKYTTPDNPRDVSDLQPLIDSILQVDPNQRPTVDDILYELQSVASARNIDLMSPVLTDRSQTGESTEFSAAGAMVSSGNAMGGSAILGNVVKGAGALFSNIKDVSSKVVQSVAGYVRNDLDISYITGKIIAMSFPAEGIESAYRNSIDDVRVYFDTKHTDHYVVINISQRQYNVSKLNDRVFESGWNSRKAPTLNQLISLCRKAYNFLRQDRDNVVAVHCLDGKTASAILVASLLIFSKLFKKPSAALDMYSLRRCQPGQSIDLNPSQKRYIRYVSQIVWEPRYLPHKKPLFLKTVTMSPVPMFNKAKTGCRPFIEIYQGEQRVLSTALDIELMREYLVSDRKVEFNVNTKLYGDVTISVFHARSTFGRKVQGKFTSFNIFTLQFHTGFVKDEMKTFKVPRSELDLSEGDEQKFHPSFGVTLDLVLGAASQELQKSTAPWDTLPVESLTPKTCFRNKEEYWECREEFGLTEEISKVEKEAMNASKTNFDTENEKKVGRSTFFETLEWNSDLSSAARPQNGEANGAKQKKPANQDKVFSNFAAMHEHARPQIGNLSGSESGGSQQDLRVCEDPIENVPSRVTTTPLIDIGVSFDGEQSGDSKLENSIPAKDLLSNSFDDEFANIRSNNAADYENKGAQNIFNSDFSDLKIETNLDTRQGDIGSPSDKSSLSKNSSSGLLLNLESTETPSERTLSSDRSMLKSPSTPNFPSSPSPNILIDTSETSAEARPARSSSLKKNRSTNDLTEKYSEDDFFQALGDDLSSPSNINSAHDSFSIASNSVIDPFSVQDDSAQFLDSFSAIPTSIASSMKHSSSDGDLLGDWGHSHTGPTLKPTSATSGSSTGFQRSSSSASDIGRNQNEPKTNDPFDFVSLSTGNFTSGPNVSKKSPTAPFNTQNFSTNNSSGFQFGSAQQQRSSSPFTSSSSFSESWKPANANAGVSQQPKSSVPKNASSQSAPNYYVGKAFSGQSVFGNTQKGGLGGGWGQRPASKSEFSDILGSQGFKPSSEQQRETLGQLKKQTDTQDMDPIKARIREWADGKERNIRALICSLHTVLWEGESRWKPCEMHQLLQPNDVKRFYKKACLAVHPDKLTGTPQEDLARAIFIELNAAWTLFEESGSKSLF